MRQMIMGCVLLLGMLPGKAQTFAEWFNQNGTRLKYYAQQIAAFQAYLGELQKGYGISDDGLGAISGGKQAEFGMHKDYYTSLGEINPVLGKMGEVAEMISLQAAIIQQFTSALARYQTDGLLGVDRLTYISQVYGNVLQAGLADVEVLTKVLTAQDFQMTDDQRLGRIKALDVATRDRYAFTLAFMDETDVLEQQQASELSEVGTLKAYYGIP
jgi:hypothetical protein